MRKPDMRWLSLAMALTMGPEASADSVAPAARVLRGPSLERWYGQTSEEAEADAAWTERDEMRLQGKKTPGKVAVARWLTAPIYDSVRRGRALVGGVRRGNTVRVRRRIRSPRCYEGRRRGRWYELEGGGSYVCSARSFRVTAPPVEPGDQLQPDLTEVLPYRYASVSNKGAPRLSRLPTSSELRLLDDPEADTQVVKERMVGDYFVALDRLEEVEGERFYRTVRQEYVREKDLEILEPPKMHGEPLGEAYRLPLAFVYGEDAPLYCLAGEEWAECGVARKHARFVALETFEHEGRQFVRGEGDIAVALDSLRMARKKKRPGKVPAGEKWLHIDLSEQTLVAYEGDRPVYATLVSTGREGYSTPTGLYRTTRKWLTRTMRGKDPVDGVYDVEEVPWVMYYLRGYAVHGAYWHDDFGKVRSHGCTNVAPIDMRWVYEWAALKVPEGWHGTNEGPGTWIEFTK